MSLIDKKHKVARQRAAKLKQYRKLMGVKAKDLSFIVGVDQSTYSRMENGFTAPTDEVMLTVEQLFKKWRKDEVERVMLYLEKLWNT